jgi:hypothetical protein
VGKTYSLQEVEVVLSAPVLVGRSKGYFWFPTAARLSDGALVVLAQSDPDEIESCNKSLVCWSVDGGLTWTEPKEALYSETNARLSSGDELFLPFKLFRRSNGVLGAPYQLCPKGAREFKVGGRDVTLSGLPRPDGQYGGPGSPGEPGRAGLVFNGQSIRLKDLYLTTAHGWFRDTRLCTLIVAESRDGVDWKYRSTVADENFTFEDGEAPMEGEGPSEAALCRLKDGRLMCIFRAMCRMEGSSHGYPYAQSWSSDEGGTWTKPIPIMNACGVQPTLVVLGDGSLVLRAYPS